MKKIIGYILISVFLLYGLSWLMMTVYFSGGFIKNNGFVKWVVYGDVVSMAKAAVWPYWIYEEHRAQLSASTFPKKFISDRENFSQSIQILDDASNLTHPNGMSETPKEQVDETKVISMIQQGIDLSQKVNDDFLDYMHPDMKDYYRNKLIKGETLFLEGLKGDTSSINSPDVQKEIAGVKLQTEWNNWWQNHSADLANKAFP